MTNRKLRMLRRAERVGFSALRQPLHLGQFAAVVVHRLLPVEPHARGGIGLGGALVEAVEREPDAGGEHRGDHDGDGKGWHGKSPCFPGPLDRYASPALPGGGYPQASAARLTIFLVRTIFCTPCSSRGVF